MFKKLLFLVVFSLSLLKADRFEEFKELCEDIEVISFVSLSNYKSLEDGLKNLKLNIKGELAEQFSGVWVENNFTKEVEEKNKKYKREVESYLKASAKGFIFPKYLKVHNNEIYKYDKSNDLITMKAKLYCKKRVYRELKRHTLLEMNK